MDNNNFTTNDNAGGAVGQASAAQGEIDALIDQMSNEQLLDAFVTQMMEEKGVREKLDEAGLAAVKSEMLSQLNYEINRAILAELPEEKLDEVERIMDEGNGDVEAIDRIIEEAGIDVAKVTEETMLAYREKYLRDDSASVGEGA